MLTGRSANAHGIVSNNYALATDMPTYAHVLRAHGYKTAGFGKFHQTPMAWPPPTNLDFLGFDEAVVTEDPKWGPYLDWVNDNHPEQYAAALAMANGHSGHQGPSKRVELLQGATAEQTSMREEAYGRLIRNRIESSEWERMYTSPIAPAAHDTTFITDTALVFLRRQTVAVPFLCHVSYVDPHDPYDPPEPYDSLYSPGEMADPLAAEWLEQGPHCLSRVQDNYLQFGRIAANTEAVRRLRALYHGQLRLLDDQIGRLIDQLKESGLWKHTIIVFSTDHGEHLGDHGMISKGFPHYDAGIRCPLIVGGGPISSHDTCDRLTCTLDLFPTFCDWAGVPTRDRPPLEGRSFAGFADPGWQDVTTTTTEVATIVSSDGFRLTLYPEPAEGQMFNLADDPDETRNVYDDTDFAEKRAELLERLVGRMVRSCGTPHYRNLPVRDNAKWNTNNVVEGSAQVYSIYPDVGSPWLTPGGLRPEWSGDGE